MPSEKYSIVFIIPYFGKLPSYFDVFLKSVADKNFDLLFFSDVSEPKDLPANCKWYVFSFGNLKIFFSKQLNINVSFKNSAKLCDFKPALGLIFSDFIKDYTFWGTMDIDVCIGNFDAFLNASLLEAIDIFSGIREYLSGSFFIIRNNHYCNNLFKKSKDWQRVFTTGENMVFDECGGQYFKELKAGKTFGEIKPTIESFTEIIFRENINELKLMFKNVIAEPKKGNTIVDKNSVVYNKEEFLLVHYIYYKCWYSFFTNKKVSFPFYINRLGFFQHKPVWITMLLSKNFRVAIIKKVMINLKKLSWNA